MLLSLEGTDLPTAWLRAEERIRDELEIEEVSVVLVPWEGREITESGFAAIASTHDATQVLMIQKENKTTATLSHFTIDGGGDSTSFKEIEINLETRRSKREKVEVVAFKTKEAVRAAAIELKKVEPKPKPIVDITLLSLETHSTLERFKPGVLAGLITGAATVTAGGVLHALSASNAQKANDLAAWGMNEKCRVDGIYQENYDSYIDFKRKSENYKTGMIITYTVGGLLTATSAVLLVVIRKREGKEETSQISLAPTVNGFVVFY